MNERLQQAREGKARVQPVQPPSAARSSGSPAADRLLGLQRMVGNQAVCDMLPSFRVGAASDSHEAGADRFADLVTSRHGYQVRRSTAGTPKGGGIGLEGGELGPNESRSLRSRLGGGRRLDSSLAREFEEAGASRAGSVHIHADADADRLARSMSANAFTVGDDIFFAKGRFRPGTPDGHRLLAHEVGHVGTGAGAPGDLIHRDVGFEFETNIVVRKKKPGGGGFEPLKKMEKIADLGGVSMEADEHSEYGSSIEFVVDHVKEKDRKALKKRLEKMQQVAEKMTGTPGTVSDEALQGLKNSDEYKEAEKRSKVTGKGNELNALQNRLYKEEVHDKPTHKATEAVSGARKDVYFTPVPKNALVANPQVTGGIDASKMYSLMSKDDADDPGKKFLFSAGSGKAVASNAELVKDLKVGDTPASDQLKGLVAQLVSYLKTGATGNPMNYAKLISGGLMARTDFAKQFEMLPGPEKQYFLATGGESFASLVLAAAGMGTTGADRVFARGVRQSYDPNSDDYDKRVAALDGLTRAEWLRRIPRGYDALSASQAKQGGNEQLTGLLEGLGRLGRATDKVGSQGKKSAGTGVVVEFRGIGAGLGSHQWVQSAMQAFDYIVGLNADA